MWSSGLKLTLCALFVCATLTSAALAGGDAFGGGTSQFPSDDEERASTIPADERELNFSVPGLIAEVNVKNGDRVKKGQVLAQLDMQVEQAALDKEQFLLNSNVQLRAAEAQRDLAEVKLKRVEGLRANNAGSLTELEEAQLELTVSKLKVELAVEETESKRLEIVRLQKQIDRMRIVCEFAGEVRKVEAAVGEVADPQRPAIVVVSNDPLWVATKVSTEQANSMKLGQTLSVRYTDEKTWREAKIIFFDPVADATVGQQLIHLEMPNPEARRAGQEMIVKLPDNVAAAK